jgi:predicted metalloprotease
MRDASGQQYMRNRYYNPQTGQFTQPDPIGLAGGLNSYGFAAGLAHEVGHVMQATDGNYTQPRATRRFLRQFRSSRSFRDGLEPSADFYACVMAHDAQAFQPNCNNRF